MQVFVLFTLISLHPPHHSFAGDVGDEQFALYGCQFALLIGWM